MKTDLDVLLFATRLVQELGDVAIRLSHVRLVELTAADNVLAANFWRDVLHAAERLVAEKNAAQLAAAAQSPSTMTERVAG